jgi:NodT family efflux transporter outer membrane factor (OMF) lipoprotein
MELGWITEGVAGSMIKDGAKHRQTPFRVAARLTLAGCLWLAGCTVGPNYTRPAAPAVGGYVDHPLSDTPAMPGVTGGQVQHLVSGADLAGDWWTLFHSAALNALIERSLKNSPDLKAAQAALSAAHETMLAGRGAYYPTITAGYGANRYRQSAALAPTPSTNASQYSLFTPQLSIAYAPDVFGLARRTNESLQAQAQAARDQMLAADITLTSNVAAGVIQEASLQAQIDATRQLIDINSKMVETLKYQASRGYAGGLDLAAQQAQLAQTEATLPALLKAEAQQQHLLAVMTGDFPGQGPAGAFDLSSLTLPADLPLSLPSHLVAQRPDVLQAEANLHAASAQVGVAAANRLPNIQLTGDAGRSSLEIDRVFGAGNGFWDLGAAITAPIFDAGALKHQEKAAKDTYVQSAEQYRSTVLSAFQNVADTLAAIEQDAGALKAAAASADAAKLTLDLSQRQYKAGYAAYLSVLTAEQAYQQARIALVQAQAGRYADTVALFQALGGGWWNRADLSQG